MNFLSESKVFWYHQEVFEHVRASLIDAVVRLSHIFPEVRAVLLLRWRSSALSRSSMSALDWPADHFLDLAVVLIDQLFLVRHRGLGVNVYRLFAEIDECGFGLLKRIIVLALCVGHQVDIFSRELGVLIGELAF